MFRTGDLKQPNDPGEITNEVTPIKVGDTLFLCTAHQRLFALDAATGKEKWHLTRKERRSVVPARHLPRCFLSRSESG